MKILIIEDETLAANRLQKLVSEIDPSIEIAKITDSITESVAFLNEQKVDLILSDIQLADGLSFEIYKQVKIDCPIIFTTAYDQYAISAFETKGIDYILKPIEKSRLEKSFNKFKDLNTKQDIDIEALKSLISEKQEQSYKKRFMIKVGDKIKSITSEEINAFYSLQKGTYLLTNSGRNYVVDYSLEEVIQLLNPNHFFKINRKVIVNIFSIKEIISHSNSRLKLVIPHLEIDEVIVAREKVNEFKKWIDQ